MQGKNATIINILAFTIFVAFTAYLYIKNQSRWEAGISSNKIKVDSLTTLATTLEERVVEFEKNELMRVEEIRNMRFDPFDSDNFRIYGLYRDVEKKYSDMQISLRFNINNANAVKSYNVLGEKWFIVPVKGVHFWKEEETLTEIATLYYLERKDSTLISSFNLDAGPGKHIFIPFDKN